MLLGNNSDEGWDIFGGLIKILLEWREGERTNESKWKIEKTEGSRRGWKKGQGKGGEGGKGVYNLLEQATDSKAFGI